MKKAIILICLVVFGSVLIGCAPKAEEPATGAAPGTESKEVDAESGNSANGPSEAVVD